MITSVDVKRVMFDFSFVRSKINNLSVGRRPSVGRAPIVT